MKSGLNQNNVRTKLFPKLKSFALLATATLLIAQTSCVQNSKPSVTKLNIYQPSTLQLKKDQPVQTVEGIYTPQVDETWHSDARYRKLERELY